MGVVGADVVGLVVVGVAVVSADLYLEDVSVTPNAHLAVEKIALVPAN